MDPEFKLRVIARIRTGFPEKFGVPRQGGLAQNRCEIIFEKEYRVREALKGLTGYEYIWLLWGFSEEEREDAFRPTVRPPRLGGNERVGVFATRSPMRPNPIGLTSVRIEGIEYREDDGPVIVVTGVDMVDGTPIYDIKPYLPYVDSHPDAREGFAGEKKEYRLEVHFPEGNSGNVSAERRTILEEILSQDPRPSYHDDPERVYGMSYEELEVHFKVDRGILTVIDIEKREEA